MALKIIRPSIARSCCLCIAAFACLAMGKAQQEAGLVVSGLSRNDVVGIESFDGGKRLRDQFVAAGANVLTLNARNANTESAKIEGSVDFWLLTGGYADALRVDSAASVLMSQGSAVLLTDIRKLYASLFFRHADVSVGRQIITFGQGMVFSPIDVFSSVNILDLSLRRRGSDVARVRVPFGDLSGIDAIAQLSTQTQDEAAAVKGYAHAGGFDCAAVGIYRGLERETITGLTFKGDLAAGVYGELVEHWRHAGNRAFTGMLGADYSIENAWFFTAEYLYNERPDTGAIAAPLSIVQTSIPLFHHHYGFGMARYKINDLMNVSVSAIGDIEGGSSLGAVQYYYNILQNANTILYIQYYRAAALGILPVSFDEATYGLRLEVAF